MPPGELLNLSHLGLGDVSREDTTDAHAPGMHMEHDLSGLLPAHMEKEFQNLNDKIHGREIIVEKQDLVFWWRLELGPGLLDGRTRRMFLIHIRTTHVNANSHESVIFGLTQRVGSLYLTLKTTAGAAFTVVGKKNKG